ncbi:MAG: hypothetical protein JKX95_03815 [Bacteroidia bacterium]|nr:hypothetical protein [Bacteroidia bacterium]
MSLLYVNATTTRTESQENQLDEEFTPIVSKRNKAFGCKKIRSLQNIFLGIEFTPGLINQKNEEKSFVFFSSGINAGYWICDRIAFNYQLSFFTSKRISPVFNYEVSTNTQSEAPSNNSDQQMTVNSISYRNNFLDMSMDILVRVMTIKQRFDILLINGLTNSFINQQQEISINKISNLDLNFNHHTSYWKTGIRFDYRFLDNLSCYIQPTYQHSLNELAGKTQTLSYSKNIGVSFGLQSRF